MLQISKNMIDYSRAYILFEVKVSISFENSDKEETFALRNSDDIITDLKVILNNIVISDEVDIDKSNL